MNTTTKLPYGLYKVNTQRGARGYGSKEAIGREFCTLEAGLAALKRSDAGVVLVNQETGQEYGKNHFTQA